MTCIAGMVGGLLAAASMTFGLFVQDKIKMIFIPLVLYICWDITCEQMKREYLSPLAMVCSSQTVPLKGSAILGFLAAGGILVFGVFMYVANKRDILKQ